MGRQTMFTMTYEDEKLFLEKLRDKFDIKIIKTVSSEPRLEFCDELNDEEGSRYRVYIWNTAFPINPEFEAQDDRYIIKNKDKLPLLDFDSGRNYGRGYAYGRIYWDNYWQDNYDAKAFSKWYESVARILRKNAVHAEGEGAYKNYFYKNAWDKFGCEVMAAAKKPEVPAEIYYIPAAEHENKLIMKLAADCPNSCPDCICYQTADHEDFDADNLYDRLCGAFNGVQTDKYTELIIGATFEPICSWWSIFGVIGYIRKNSDLKITIISNGLSGCITPKELSQIADRVILFINGTDEKDYLAKCNPSKGIAAYKQACAYARRCLKIMPEKLTILENRRRAEAYKYALDPE